MCLRRIYSTWTNNRLTGSCPKTGLLPHWRPSGHYSPQSAFPGTDAAFALLGRICDSELPSTLTGKGLAPEPRVSFDVHFLDPYELNRSPLT